MDDPLAELVMLLARLPGIGERTATRLAHHVLGADPQYAAALGASIAQIHERVRHCERCGNWALDPLCRVCADPRRDPAVLCVVARVPDLAAIEKSGTFRGRYHVLHALLAPLDGIGPDAIDVDRLITRVREEGVREVVVATPLSVEGEATALYLAQSLKPFGARVSRIASGLPHGGELEFADQITLGRALDGRREL
ncbi:recombination mediator RecR [Sandaracinus amylolyticus]|uniref:recombination mediator RecR n=1 Tax=Sandaracinus amylolyticus TaxID=927083 RepID=UPI001EFFB8FD|nr:recombination mediator RecR [Sandaracinus amylolyticus]UJR79551.1 DNA replication and repair protein RecR [Sandaracinus amylolyticus]